MENTSDGCPWEDHGPRAMMSVPLQDIDDADKRFQFRFASSRSKLGKSLAERGQLNPIKIMPGDGTYVIIDGFSRYAEAKRQDWKEIKALLYPSLSVLDAKKISWECNIVRVNLSPTEKANGILLARKDGLARKEIASLFRVSDRHVNRCLELPERLRAFIDGEVMTMAHAYVLKDYVDDLTDDDLVSLVEWVRIADASSKKLRTKIKRELVRGQERGRPKGFGCVETGRVRGYEFDLRPQSTAEDWASARQFFLEAIREIEVWIHRSAIHPEKDSGSTFYEEGG